MAEETLRQRYLRTLTSLESQRSTWDPDWRDCADYINPWNYRRTLSETNQGGRRARKIINDTAGDAVDVMSAGMMAGITNPATVWLNLRAQDPDLNDYQPVREWLETAIARMMQSFAASNIYEAFHTGYYNLGQFGTHCQLLADDPQDTLRAYVFPVGEFALATSDRQEVDTVYRRFRMTVRQMVQWFGVDKVSTRTRDLHDKGQLHQELDVVYVCEPNSDFEDGKLGTKGKPWLASYLELGPQDASSNVDGFLSQQGYFEFPHQAPRWRALPGNVYGVGPGLKAMGDIKGLQQLERDKGKGVQKMIDPPMVGPASMQNEATSILPGAMNYTDQIVAGQVFRPAMEVVPQSIAVVEASIREHEARIKSKFHADLWLLMAEQEGGPQMTAREVAEKHEEKMMQLGPVLQSIEREWLSPFIHRALAIHLRRKLLPPPPPEIQLSGYSVEYLSVVSRALKMIQNGGIDATSAFVGRFAGVRPEVLDVVNLDAMVREYASNTGMKSSLLNSEDVVAKVRAQRQQQMEAQQQAENAQKLAAGAQTLSQTNTTGDNGLTRLLSSLPGAATSGVS